MDLTKVAANVITDNAAIGACEEGGQWQFAQNLPSFMTEAKVAVDAITTMQMSVPVKLLVNCS